MVKASRSARAYIQVFFRLLLILTAISPLGYTIYREWPELSSSLRGIGWEAFTLAQLMLIPVMLLVGVIPWASLHYLGCRFSYPKATGIYFATQVLKYLPGGIWAFPGRVAVYQMLKVGSAQSVISVFRETASMFLGAAAIGLLGLLQGLSLSNNLRIAIGVGIFGCAVVIVLTQIPWFWRFFSHFRLFSSSPMSAYDEVNPGQRNIRWLPGTFFGSLLFFGFFGLPFRQMAIAVFPGISSFPWLEAASIFALAWCAGFIVIFIPAGIGVREGVLTFLLSNVMPIGSALSLALLSRMTWVIAEGFWILVTLILAGKHWGFSMDSLRKLRITSRTDDRQEKKHAK
jgi:hypothetical protein